jgi:uncharacterized membrane protein
MKHLSVFVLISCACLVPLAWAQQSAGSQNSGIPQLLRHRIMNRMTQTPGAAYQLSTSAPASAANHLKTWDLGHYPGGTWAQLWGVNSFGIAAGWGDVAGEKRMIGVPLYGLSAGKWFDSGVSSQDDIWGCCAGITDTALIVGSVTGKDGFAKAYAWSPNHGGMELGILAGDEGSEALAVNHLGTLIVGVSYRGITCEIGNAVAWTPEIGWHDGKWAMTWKIHKLPTGGLDQPGRVYDGVTLNDWGGWGVNDLGQIAGDGWSDNYDELAVVWNPIHGGREWELQQLPAQTNLPFAEHKYTEALSINNRGQIVGVVTPVDGWTASLPALWTMSPRTHTWELTVLPTLLGEPAGWSTAWYINDLGDVVGQSVDADGNSLATRWLTKDPSFVKAIGFPGDTSQALQVNNFGIVVGSYSSGGGPDQAFAAAIR